MTGVQTCALPIWDYEGAILSISRCLDVMLETRAWQAAAFAMLDDELKAAAAFAAFIYAFEKKWQGPAPPVWPDIENWLKMAIPLVWPEGRVALDRGLIKARAFYEAGDPHAALAQLAGENR